MHPSHSSHSLSRALSVSALVPGLAIADAYKPRNSRIACERGSRMTALWVKNLADRAHSNMRFDLTVFLGLIWAIAANAGEGALLSSTGPKRR